MTPKYRARTSVQLEGFNNDQVTPISTAVPNASPENYLQNEVKVLESETLAERVADALGIDGRPTVSRLDNTLGSVGKWFPAMHAPEESNQARRIKKVQSALTIRTSLQSQVIEVFFDAPNPEQAARGANAAVAAFVALNREARQQLVKDTTDWLNQQAADLRASVQKANQHLQAFAQSSGLILAGNEGTVAQEQTHDTQEALARAEEDRAAKQSRYETASAKGDDFIPDANTSSAFHQYQVDLATMRRDLAQLTTIYTPTNYKVERLQAQIAETEHAMEEERKATVARMGNDYAAASRLEKLLADAHDRQLKTAQQEMANDRQYDTLKSEIDNTQKLYETILEKASEAGAASALRATNIRVIDSAMPPSAPYSPRTGLNMAIGLFLGALGGIGFVFASENKGRVTQPADIRVLDMRELGVIPSARDARALEHRMGGGVIPLNRTKDLGLVTRDQRGSIISESFRGALTSILFGTEYYGDLPAPAQTKGCVLVITSVDMMEGKTTILTNLGVVAAERKQRVLLIDADLRRPRLQQIFDLPNERGLTDLLSRNNALAHGSLDSFIQPTITPGLFVLTSGPVDAKLATSVHSSLELRPLLERCRREFDLILIDTPPLMLYADGRILGRSSDGVVMVVRSNTRSHSELKTVYDKLRQDQIPLLGTILNDWRMDSGQSRAYGRYYDHYQPQ
jgi:capsular exopolysaccharide synthesis family protein